MRDILQYVGVFVDGHGYFGEAKKAELPKIKLATRDFSASGMSGPIKVRMARLAQDLRIKLTFEACPVALFDLLSVREGELVPLRLKGSTQGADGTVTKHEIVARAFVEEFDEGTWEEDKENALMLDLSLRHYERHIGGIEKWVITPETMVLRKNGQDLLAEHRANIGR